MYQCCQYCSNYPKTLYGGICCWCALPAMEQQRPIGDYYFDLGTAHKIERVLNPLTNLRTSSGLTFNYLTHK